jgi:guanylate kinase
MSLGHWSSPSRGVLFVVTGPSGVGKSTLIRHVRDVVPHLSFSVSATTRSAREGETDGVDYFFLSEAAFQNHLDADRFLEHAEVYQYRYGTLQEPVEQALSQGQSIILDIDLKGARQIRKKMPEAVFIYILPPAVSALRTRLIRRGTDSDEVIQRRMTQVEEQLSGCGEYDYLVVNDELEEAKTVIQSFFIAEICRRARREEWIQTTIGSMKSGA